MADMTFWYLGRLFIVHFYLLICSCQYVQLKKCQLCKCPTIDLCTHFALVELSENSCLEF